MTERARETAALLLEGAANLLEKEEHWTQGAFARDENGQAVRLYGSPADRQRAHSFCLDGAVTTAAHDLGALYSPGHFAANEALYEAVRKRTDLGVLNFNDTPGRTHAEVLAVVREAREALSA